MNSIFLYLALLTSTLGLGDELETMSKKLIDMRSQVQTLSMELEAKRAEMKNEIQSIGMQKTELETLIQREALQKENLEKKIQDKKSQIESARIVSDPADAVIVDAAKDLKRYIKNSLPFQIQERIKGVDQLLTSFQENNITRSRAISELWSLYEDEIRLSKENSMHKQVLRFHSDEVLADVIKIGTVALLARTNDDQFAYAVRTSNGSFQFVQVNQGEIKDGIQNVFEKFALGQKTGEFKLPTAIFESWEKI